MALFLQKANTQNNMGQYSFSDPGVIIIENTGRLLAVSEEIASMLHIEEQMTIDRSDLTLNILSVCPEFLDEKNLEEHIIN